MQSVVKNLHGVIAHSTFDDLSTESSMFFVDIIDGICNQRQTLGVVGSTRNHLHSFSLNYSIDPSLSLITEYLC